MLININTLKMHALSVMLAACMACSSATTAVTSEELDDEEEDSSFGGYTFTDPQLAIDFGDQIYVSTGERD